MTGNLELMPDEVVPGAGPIQRRARPAIMTGLPHRGEAAAAVAVLALVAHLLLAQLTLATAVTLTVITRASRWRLWWLTIPAAAGLAWTLAAGPGHAAAGFAAGPGRVLGHLDRGPLFARLSHFSGAFDGAGSWLPGQFPLALIAGAAEAAVAGWLGWPRAHGQAAPPPRPGLLAALRRSAAARLVRSGAVLTREGCALGVVAATGGVAELRWTDIADGLLIAGAAELQVTVTSLQVVHAALRRRKPLIVIDGGGMDITAALAAACAAAGVPLRLISPASADRVPPAGDPGPPVADPGQVATDLEQVAVNLGQVVAGREAALFTAGSPGEAALAGRAITALRADLRRIGADGDGIVWVAGAQAFPDGTLAELIRDGGAGLPALIGTTSPSAATELAGLAGAVLIHRVADPALAASLGARISTGYPPDSPDRTLLSLGRADFVLAVTGRGRRVVRSGRIVPARLPRGPVRAAGTP